MPDEGMHRHRQRLFELFPAARAIDAALTNTANPTPLFFMGSCSHQDLQGSWFALGRLGPALEHQFQINGEVVFLFSPFEDLQRRTMNAMGEPLRSEIAARQLQIAARQVEGNSGGRFTPDPVLAMLWSPDPEISDHLESWNADGGGTAIAAIRQDYSADPAEALGQVISDLTRVLSARDLYSGKNPVSGNDFFGREQLLRELHAELRAGKSVSIFGLRRSGKTSIIKEFTRRYSKKRIVVLDVDIETAGSSSEIRKLLANRINVVLTEVSSSDPDFRFDGHANPRVDDFTDLASLLARVGDDNRDYQFVIVMDEIESLFSLIRTEPEEVRLLLGVLKAAAQHSASISLVLSGVTARFFRESNLRDEPLVENPMFDFLMPVYVTPFRPRETGNLLTKLGRWMTLDWSDGAIERVHEISGGMPTLVRRLASDVRARALETGGRDEAGRVPIAVEMVDEVVGSWTTTASQLWDQVTRPLSAHHPAMGELVLTDSDNAIEERLQVGGQDFRDAAESLKGLGMLERAGGQWRATPTLQAMRHLGTRSPIPLDDLIVELRDQSDADPARIRRLAEQDEDQRLEFKDRLKINIHTGGTDVEITKPVIKTIAAFSNTEGGQLLIGVEDNGTISGIDDELRSFRKGTDEYLRFLQQKMRDHLSGLIAAERVSVKFVEVNDRTVCMVEVSRSSTPVWFKDGPGDDSMTFFIREGNETVSQSGPEMLGYIKRRYPEVN